jgi:hypothetical protein
VLASGEKQPIGIAVDDTNVYWTNFVPNGDVKKCDKNNCAPTTIASGQGVPVGIAVDSANVYWANSAIPGGSVVTCDKTNCANGPTTLADARGAWNVAVDANDVYWVTLTGQNDSVRRCAKTGCGNNPTVLASNANGLWGIAVDDTVLYWAVVHDSDGGSVMRCATSSCSPVVLSAGNTPQAVALNGAVVAWAETWAGNIVVADKLNYANRTIVATGQDAFGMTIDETSAYWSSPESAGFTPNTIKMAPLDGGSSTVIADSQNGPRNVAVDQTSVYWTNYNSGTVMKVAKP